MKRKPSDRAIREQQAVIRTLQNQVADYKRRHDYMVNQLSHLSQRVASKPHWYQEAKHSWSDAMAYSASEALAYVAKLPLRDPN
jgi:uncharacterized coiled-coil protein SlyX